MPSGSGNKGGVFRSDIMGGVSRFGTVGGVSVVSPRGGGAVSSIGTYVGMESPVSGVGSSAGGRASPSSRNGGWVV